MIIILFFGVISFITSLIALKKCQSKETILAKPYKVCEIYGSFVWADHVVFGFFWSIVSLITFLLNDLFLFLLIFSLFWLVRATGEVVYWFLQQFHPRPGNEPHLFWINKYIPGQAVWFVHQIFWQCVSVIALVLSIYFTYLWLTSLN